MKKILLWIPLLNFFEFFVYAVTLFTSKKDISLSRFYSIALLSLISMVGLGTIEMKFFNFIFDYSAKYELLIQYYVQGLTIAFISFYARAKVLKFKNEDT